MVDRRTARSQRHRRGRACAGHLAVNARYFLNRMFRLKKRARTFHEALVRQACGIDGIGTWRSTMRSAGDAAPCFARLSSPHYHACAMDGIALAHRRRRLARAKPRRFELRIRTRCIFVNPAIRCRRVRCGRDDRASGLREVGERRFVQAFAPYAHVRADRRRVVATEAVVARARTLGTG